MEKLTNNLSFLFKTPKVGIAKGRIDFVLERCKGKKVLHLGCVDEGLTQKRIDNRNLLHLKLLSVTQELWGVDISEDGIKLLREHGINNLFIDNIEDLQIRNLLKQQNFDIILLTEVLEHLNNPGLFLQNVKEIFTQHTQMIITVPNGLRLTGLGFTLKGYEFVHPDHNCWFSPKTLDTLMKKNGFEIEEMLAYSFMDHTTPIFKTIYRKIIKLCHYLYLNNRISYKKNCNLDKVKKTTIYEPKIFSRVSFSPNWIFEILIRRCLYRYNPFFVSDGIIITVKPKN